MTDTTSTLEHLLRSVDLKRGRIAIDCLPDGSWGAGVFPFDHSQPSYHHLGNTHGDPVNALRAALLQFERNGRDLKRRYAAAPKAGDVKQWDGFANDAAVQVVEEAEDFDFG